MQELDTQDEAALAGARDLLAHFRGRGAGDGVVIGTFAGFDDGGQFLVALGAAAPVLAMSIVGLSPRDAGARVVVAFERADPRAPVIMGRLQAAPIEREVAHLKVDGKRIRIEAQEQLELRCGEASLVLTSAGKVLIRGTHVVSRSRGANKVKGAFVEIN